MRDRRTPQRVYLLLILLLTCISLKAQQVSTFPWNEDFEGEIICPTGCETDCNLLGDISNETDPAFSRHWRSMAGPTSTGNTGPNVDNTLGTNLGHYIYAETSSPCNDGFAALSGSSVVNSWGMVSPTFDFTDLPFPRLSFFYHMFGDHVGELSVRFREAPNLPFGDPITVINGEQHTSSDSPWTEFSAVLPELGGLASVQFQVVYKMAISINGDVALDDFSITAAQANDVGVESIDMAEESCGLLPNETISVTLTNFGGVAQSDIPVEITLNGVTSSAGVFAGPLAPRASATHTFKADLSAIRRHELSVITALNADGNADNDQSALFIDNSEGIRTFPYRESFEAGPAGWEAKDFTETGRPAGTWELGTPASDVIQGASDGTQAWKTNLDGLYNRRELSWVQSPCFNFSELTSPQISLDVWWDILEEGGSVLYSIDSGLSWATIGDPNSGGINWFNRFSISGLRNDPPFNTRGHGWRGTGEDGSGQYLRAMHDVPELAGETNVIFMVAFGANGFGVRGDGFAFDNFEIRERPAKDVKIASVETLPVFCGTGTTEVMTISMVNTGLNTLENVPVSFSLNGGAFQSAGVLDVSAIDPANLTTGSTVLFDVPIALENIGDNQLEIRTELPGDEDNSNDLLSTVVVAKRIVDAFPYRESFENGTDTWTSTAITEFTDQSEDPWQLGVPDALVIKGASEGTQAWVTNLTGKTGASDQAFVESPCFDFTHLDDPEIAVDIWYESSAGLFGAVLQSSIDDGASWQAVGSDTTGINWYNAPLVSGLFDDRNGATPFVSDKPFGWSGSVQNGSGSGDWISARHDLIGLANQPNVRLRFVYSNFRISNVIGISGNEGFGFDNIVIQQKAVGDLGVAEILSPESNCNLGEEVVSVVIENRGSRAQSVFAVNLQVDDRPIVTQAFDNTPVPAFGTINLTLDVLADLSGLGTHELKVWTSFATDPIATNDTASVAVVSLAGVSQFPFNEDFEDFDPRGSDASETDWSVSPNSSTPDRTAFWRTNSGFTSSSSTGPSNDNTFGENFDGRYLFTEIDFNSESQDMILLSPCLDFSQLTFPAINYAYHMFGEDIGALHVEVNQGGPDWQILETISGEQHGASSDAFSTSQLDLSTFAGSSVRIRFRVATTGTGTRADIALDDISIFESTRNDAGVVALNSPENPIAGGTENVSVSIHNFASVPLESAIINWEVNGVAQPAFNFTGNVASGGNSQPIDLGAIDFLQGLTRLKFETALPNGQVDNDPTNDAFETFVCTPLSGTFTVGPNGDFTTLSQLTATLSGCGVSGPVTINVESSDLVFEEQVLFTNIPGASEINRVSINGNGATIVHGPREDDFRIVGFDGAEHITFGDFVITLPATNIDFGVGIHFINQAGNNLIRNCTIDPTINNAGNQLDAGIAGGGSISDVDVFSSEDNPPTSGSTFENNTIIGGARGIVHGIKMIRGSRNEFVQNRITDPLTTGILADRVVGNIISGNEITRSGITSTSEANAVLIEIDGDDNEISANELHAFKVSPDLIDNLDFFIINATGMRIDGGGDSGRNIIFNNLIYDFEVPGTITAIDLISGGVEENEFYNNTIAFHNENGVEAEEIIGLKKRNTNDPLIFWENLISIKQPAEEDVIGFSFRLTHDANDLVIIDYNSVFVSNTGSGVALHGKSRNNELLTLSDWQNSEAEVYDAHGFDTEPLFVDYANGDLSPSEPALNNSGFDPADFSEDLAFVLQDILTNIPQDFLDEDRGDPNDIGAIEFDVSAIDAGLVSLVRPTSTNIDQCGLSASEQVTVSVRNSGTTFITSLPLSFTVNDEALVTETFTVNINPGDTLDITFTDRVDLSSGFDHELEVSVNLPGDENEANDELAVVLNLGQSAPYFQGFESFTPGFSSVYDDGWQTFNSRDNLVNPRWITNRTTGADQVVNGPTFDQTRGGAPGGNYMFAHFDSSPGADTHLLSPCIDLSDLEHPSLRFFYHMPNDGTNSLLVEVLSGGSFIRVDSIIGRQQSSEESPWEERIVNLGQFKGERIKVRFTAVQPTLNSADISIDDFEIFNEIGFNDASVTFDSFVSEYTNTPLAHVVSHDFTAIVSNRGTLDNSNVTLNLSVNGATENVNLGTMEAFSGHLTHDFTTELSPTQVGEFLARLTVNITENDTVVSNDIAEELIAVSDTIYSRDDGVVSNTLGSRFGTVEMGQVFDFIVEDELSSVSFHLDNPQIGDEVHVLVRNFDQLPTDIITISENHIITEAGFQLVSFVDLVLPAGRYFIAVEQVERFRNLDLSYTENRFTPNTAFVNFDNFAFRPMEQQVARGAFLIRANLGANDKVVKADQTITFNPLAQVRLGDADFQLNATASSGLEVSYVSSDEGIARVENGLLIITGGGTATITAQQAGSSFHNAAPDVSQQLVVAKADQQITFSPLPTVGLGTPGFSPLAISTSGLAVTYVSSNTDVVTVSGGLLSVVGTGTTTITASQAGNDSFNPATDVVQELTVGQGIQSIGFASLEARNLGDPDFELPLLSNAGLAITYASSDETVATILGNVVTMVGVGTTTITGVQPGNTQFEAAAPRSQDLQVNGRLQTITFEPIADKSFGDPAFALVATASSGLGVTFTSADESLATIEGNTVTITGGGLVTISAQQVGNEEFSASPVVTQSFTVNPIDQTIVFDPLANVRLSLGTLVLGATASSGLAVEYSISNPSIATVNGNELTLLSEGTVDITASQPGDNSFNTAPEVIQRLTIADLGQTITFNALPDLTFGDASFDLSATATSGLEVIFTSSDLDIATIDGNTVTIVGGGDVTITASQPGNAGIDPAPPVARSFEVFKADQTITFNDDLSNLAFSGEPVILTATASSGLPLRYESSDESVATLNGNELNMVAPGTATITAFQDGNNSFNEATSVVRELLVNLSAQTITFDPLPATPLGTLLALNATASSGLEVTYRSSDESKAVIINNTANLVGLGEVTIIASQAGNDGFSSAEEVSRVLTVSKLPQVITFAAVQNKSLGDLAFNLSAFASSGLDVSFQSSDPTVATIDGSVVTIVGAGQTTLTASQSGDESFDAAPNVAQNLTVGKGAQVIEFQPLTQSVLGGDDFELTAIASSGLPVTYTSSDPSVATVSGTTVTILGIGTSNITASQAGNANFEAAADVVQPLPVIGTGQTIDFAALANVDISILTQVNLNATASSGLAVTFEVVSGPATLNVNELTLTGTGQVTIAARQAGNATFSAATNVIRSFNAISAAKQDQTVSFNTSTRRDFDADDFTLNATASSGLAVRFISSDPSVVSIDGNTGSIHAVGEVTLTALQDGDDAFNPAVFVRNLEIRKASQSLGFTGGSSFFLDEGTFELLASVPSGLPITYTSEDESIISISGNIATMHNTGRVRIFAVQPGNENFNASNTRSRNFTVSKRAQKVRLDAFGSTSRIIGDPPFELSGSSDSDLPVTIFQSSNPDVALVAGNKVIMVGVGTTTLSAIQPGNEVFASDDATRTLRVNKKSQTITFNSLADVTLLDTPIQLEAFASSGLPVTYTSSDESVATFEGSELTIHNLGTTRITASQAGNDFFNAASNRFRDLDVVRLAQTITFEEIANKILGVAPFRVVATASSGLPVSFSSSDETIATVEGDLVSVVGAGTVRILANQVGNAAFAAAEEVSELFTVERIVQTITFDELPEKTVGDPDFELVATTNSGLPVSFISTNGNVATISGNTVTIVGGGNVNIIASQAGSDDIDAAENVVRRLTVNKLDQTITFDPITNRTFGDDDFDPQANSTSGLVVSYSSSDSDVINVNGNLLEVVGVGTATITAIQDGNNQFNEAVRVVQEVNVIKANQVINFDPLVDKVFDDADFELTATASSGLPINYISSDLSVATVTGSTVNIVGTGTTTITALNSGNANFNAAANVSQTLRVNKKDQLITFNALPEVTFEDPDFALVATSDSGLPVTFVSSDASVATISGNRVTIVGAGVATITAQQSGSDDFNQAPDVERQLTVNKKDQVITFNVLNEVTFGDPSFSLVATSDSGLLVSFGSSDETTASINGTQVTIEGAGLTVITASQAGNENFNPAPDVVRNLVVNKADQTITFEALENVTFGDNPFDLSATSSSGLAVAYASSDESVVTINGSTITIVGAGNVVITASQAGNRNFNPAPDVAQTLVVEKADQVITFDPLTAVTFGNDPFELSAIAGSGLAVSFQSSDETVARVEGTTVTIIGAGTTTITASQAGNSNFHPAPDVMQPLVVNKADQVITFEPLANVTFGDDPFELTATASSALAVTYVSSDESVATVNGTTVTIVGAGIVNITASQSGNDDFNAAPNVIQSLVIEKADQVITFNPLVDVTFGDASFELTATASSDLPVSYTSSDESIMSIDGTTVTINGGGIATITASQSGNDDFNAAADVVQQLTVNKADQVITFNELADATFGDDPMILNAQASSGLPVSYASADETVATIEGNILTIVGAGETVITASQAGNTDFNGAANVARTLNVNKADQIITFDPLETKTFGDAPFEITASSSAELAITFTSSDESLATVNGNTVTITGAGIVTITASQAGNDDFNPANEVSQQLTVNKANQVISFNPIETKTFGDAAFALEAESNSGLPVVFASSDESVARVNGTEVTIAGAGTTVITASQGGNDNFNPAPDVTQQLVVNKANQVVSFNPLASVTFGDAPFELTATASSALAVTYVSSDESVAIINGTTVTIVGAGTVNITASQTGNDDFNAAENVIQPLVVEKADQVITFNALDDVTFGEQSFELDAIASSGLVISYASSDESVVSIEGTTATIRGGGIATITASQSGNDDFNTAIDVLQQLTVNKANQIITFEALEIATFGDEPITLNGQASSGLLVSYVSADETVAKVEGNTLTIVGAGTTNITASQEGNNDFNPAEAIERVFTVGKASQVIVFAPLNNVNFGDDRVELEALASSGLAVSFTSSDETVATIEGSTVTIVSAGVVTITALQSGNENFKAAGDVAQILTVDKANQVISFDPIEARTFGDDTFDLQATANSGLSVVFASSDESIATINGTEVTIVGAGTAVITASQDGNDNFESAENVVQTLIVNKAEQAIIFTEVVQETDISAGTINLAATSTSGLNVSFELISGPVTLDGAILTLNDIGIVQVRAVQAGNENFNAAAPAAQTFNIVDANRENQVITFDSIEDSFFGAPDFNINAIASSGLAVSLSSSNENVAIINGNTVTVVGVGQTDITASQAGSAQFNPAISVVQSFTVNKATQTITFTELEDKTFRDVPFELVATSDADLPVSFVSSDEKVVTINGATVTIVGAGVATITASQAGNTNFNAAVDVQQQLTVNKAAQAITFSALADVTFGDADFDLTATSSSGLGVSYISSDESVVTVNGSTVTIVGAGVATITASQAGNTNFNAAVDVQQQLTVNKAAQAITFSALADVTFGDANFDLTATSSSGLGVSYISSDESVVTVNGSTVTIVGAGVATITASQAGNTDFNAAVDVQQQLTVNKAAQAITFSALADVTFGDADFDLTATSSSGLGVSYISSDESVVTVNGSTVTIVGAGVATITASQAGNTDFNAAVDVQQQLAVNKAAQAITFSALADVTFGDADFDLTATSSSGLGVSYISSDESVVTVNGSTVTIVGAGVATITASQAGNTDFNAAVDVQQQLAVNKAAQAITFSALADVTFGDADFDLTATSSSGLGVSYISSDESVVTVNGSTVTIVGAGVATITASQTGNTNFNAAVDVQQQLIVNKAAQAITFRALADVTFGDADFDLIATSSSGLGVNYISSDESVVTVNGSTVTVVGTGVATITASQTGNTNFNATVDVQQQLTVNKAAQAITFSALADKIFGDVPFELVATSDADLSVSFVSSDVSIVSIEGNTATIHRAGEVIITASQAGNENIEAAESISQALVVNKTTQIITFNALADVTFGDSPFELAATSTAGLPVSFVSSDPSVLSIDGITASILGAGEVTLTAIQEGNENIEAAESIVQLLVINRASLIATVADQERRYGQENPVFTIAYEGFVNGQTAADITEPTASTTALITSDVGVYPIILTGGGSTNYEIQMTNGQLIIDKTELLVTANNFTKEKGEENPEFTLVYNGFVNNDDESDLDAEPIVTADAETNSPQGQYELIVSGGADNNYFLTFQNGTLTVLAAILNIPGELVFEDTPIRESSIQVLTVGNTGDADLRITEVNLPNGFTVDRTAVTIGPGSTADFNITFSPDQVSVFGGDIVFSSNDEEKSLSVTGTGIVVTSIDDEVLDAEEIMLMPNPANVLLTIDLSAGPALLTNLKIVNPEGLTMWKRDNAIEQNIKVDVSEFRQGVYLLMIETSKGRVTKKVIIKR